MNQYIVLGLILLALTGWGTYEHSRFLSLKTEYSEFKETAATQALKQEKDHAIQVNNALAERDIYLNRLRDSEIRTRALRASITPQGPDRLCFNRPALDAAIQSFLGEVQGLIEQGDVTLINLQATLAAWPK